MIKHLLYVTTNLVNSMVYIGVHSTYNENDGYLGSGIELKKAVKIYGSHNFRRCIIERYASRDQALHAEGVMVDSDFVARVDTYNQKRGGCVRDDTIGFSGMDRIETPEEHAQRQRDAIATLRVDRNITFPENRPVKKITTQPKQERTGKLYVSLPQDLFDRLDEVLLIERKKRRPDKVDKSILVEEALQAWLKKQNTQQETTQCEV